jgi:hypothetical protein
MGEGVGFRKDLNPTYRPAGEGVQGECGDEEDRGGNGGGKT